MTSPATVTTDPGSFRDPSGIVFFMNGEVFRGVSDATWTTLQDLKSSGLLDKLIADGRVVRTEFIADDTELHANLRAAQPGFTRFMRHEKVPFISYPYEWSRRMIADAALSQLALQRRLIQKGFSLKDATIYNTQFIKGRPVFIDLPSIERPAKLGIWVAYGQFCRHFLFPLILAHHRSIDLGGYYLANMDGMGVESVYKILGGWRSARPSLLVDVFLQRHLQSYGQRNIDATRRKMAATGDEKPANADTSVQLINLDRLSRKVRKLRDKKETSGHWVGYATSNTYSDEADSAKKQFIQRFAETKKPSRVLDLGCNTGAYSRIAAAAGASVVAADIDPECADHLYDQVTRQSLDILPICLDCANPSPGIGFMNRERSSFLDRTDFDAVFGLALLHHLLISSRIPLPATRDFFATLTRRWLVLEFVGRQDSMFQHLLALREDIYGDITRANFEAVYSTKFTIIERQELPGSDRCLYLLEKLPPFACRSPFTGPPDPRSLSPYPPPATSSRAPGPAPLASQSPPPP